jgi:hypothetical protein
MTKMMWMLPLIAITAACSKAEDQASAPAAPQSEAARESADASSRALGEQPPGIDANVAPGVAFDYAYRFSLPEDQISATQEAHAAQCGRLGIAHCRVTGLTFTKDRDGGIDASLSFKVDPAIALTFGRDATEIVERAEGQLETSEVSGRDKGSAIVANDKDSAAISAELAKITAQLKIPGLSKSVRSDLVARQAELNGELRTLKGDRDKDVESLATTPMRFDYEVGGTIMGLNRGSTAGQGIYAASSSLTAMGTFVALVLGIVGPWALGGGLIWWLVRRVRQKKAVAAGE